MRHWSPKLCYVKLVLEPGPGSARPVEKQRPLQGRSLRPKQEARRRSSSPPPGQDRRQTHPAHQSTGRLSRCAGGRTIQVRALSLLTFLKSKTSRGSSSPTFASDREISCHIDRSGNSSSYSFVLEIARDSSTPLGMTKASTNINIRRGTRAEGRTGRFRSQSRDTRKSSLRNCE